MLFWNQNLRFGVRVVNTSTVRRHCNWQACSFSRVLSHLMCVLHFFQWFSFLQEGPFKHLLQLPGRMTRYHFNCSHSSCYPQTHYGRICSQTNRMKGKLQMDCICWPLYLSWWANSSADFAPTTTPKDFPALFLLELSSWLPSHLSNSKNIVLNQLA